MTSPLSVCLEDLGVDPSSDRYMQCVAMPGRQPGLTVSVAGQLRWRDSEDVAVELWVSADDRLIAYRPGGARASVHRAGRGLELPIGKPVVLLTGDELQIGGRTFRVHLHGVAQEVRAPSPWKTRLRGAVAVAAVGASIGASACTGASAPAGTVPVPSTSVQVDQPPAVAPDASPPPIEVRETPPAPMPSPSERGQ